VASTLATFVGLSALAGASLLGAGFGLWTAVHAAEPPAARAPAPEAAPTPGRLAALDPQVHEVAAFLKANCLECHNHQDRVGDLSLEKFTDAATIRKDRATWARIVTMVGGGSMPPEAAEKPVTGEHRQSFLSAAKHVLAYTDPSRPDPGRVTLRRLNRLEYDNTVLALLGADFQPSKEFPPDDVSGGYDNNGEGLTLSPLLMERYLVASDAIIAQVMPEPGFWPLLAKLENLTPAPGAYRQTSLGRDKIRHLLPGMQLGTNGAINTEGDYVIKAFAYWHKGGSLEMPILEMLWDDQVVYSGPVDVIGYEGSIFYETPPVRLKPGSHKMTIRWPLKEGQKTPTLQDIGAQGSTGQDEPPGLYIRWAEISGPRNVKTDLLKHDAALSPRDAAREVIARIARKAYRRPVTDDDVNKLLAFYDASQGVKELDAAYNDVMSTQALTWYQAVRPALQAILVSPHFLFRVEEDPQPDALGPHPITDFQLASRLSYFLWSAPPDDELMALAEKNQLRLQLEEQVRRMLKDPRADSLTENFASQWLHLRMLDKVMPDKTQFPEYYQSHSAGRDQAPLTMRDFMKTESLKFFNDVQRQDRSILDLIDGHYTYLNGPLASLYGIVDTRGNLLNQKDPLPGGTPIRGTQFVRVELQGTRSGLLTHASLLTITSNPGRTSPVKRGKFILEQFLGAAPPPPPPNVPELESTKVSGGTLRQIMEQHRANPACAACHIEMDAIGFSFENFDAIGRFREKEGDSPIDTSGTFPGGVTFTGVAELKKVLRGRSDEFAACLTEQLMTYALGRQVQHFDKPAVDRITRAVATDGYKFSRVVVEIVKSDPFRLRRGKDQTDD
jgi:hypothetical protein